jgi:hypothetical protein
MLAQLHKKQCQIHKKAMHEETHTNQCDKCFKTFKNRYTLKRHVNNCNGFNNPLQCDICMGIFTHRNNKYKHRKKCLKNYEETQNEINTHKITPQNINIVNNNTIDI